MKRQHKPLRLKVNSHTGAGKTYFIRHHDANYRGCRLLDFDDFEGANRSSALLLAYDACAVLLGSAHLDKHSSLPDVAYVFVVPSLKDIRRNVAKRNEAVGDKHHEEVVERDVHPQEAGAHAWEKCFAAGASGSRSFLRSKMGVRASARRRTVCSVCSV